MDESVSEQIATDRPERFARLELSAYGRLLHRLRDEGRRFVDVRQRTDGVVLHHDVELSLSRALTMARLEATHRIRGTYCIPIRAPLHDTSTVAFVRTVRSISRLGHEVGLQFDPTAHWEESPSEAALLSEIDRERKALSRVAETPVEVVSFRRPTKRLSRLELPDAINVCRDPEEPSYRVVTDRELPGTDPFPDGVPERFRLLIHPGLWRPVARSESAVVETYRREAAAAVEAYFDAFDIPTPRR
ncbi:MAG: hypothetical protein ACOCQM_01155 [Natronomonas sp.]